MTQMRLVMANIENIKPNPMQPREGFDREKLLEMAETIKTVGLIHPLIVREHYAGYQIVAGERRWRACELAKVKQIPVIVKKVEDKRLLLESLIENIHREDLTSVERERAVYEIWKTGEYRTYDELAKALSYDRRTVSAIIEAKEFREKKKVAKEISTTTLRETAVLPPKERAQLIEKIKREEIASRKVRDVVKTLRKATEPVRKAMLAPESRITPDIAKEITRVPDEAAQKYLLKLAEKVTVDEIKDEVAAIRARLKKGVKFEVAEPDLGKRFLDDVLNWISAGEELRIENVKYLTKVQKAKMLAALEELEDKTIKPLMKALRKR
jgi:ParB family chromosome partitioning protein